MCHGELLAVALREKGYAIIDDALPPALAAALRQTSIEQLERHSHAAGVGRQQDHAVNHGIRGDHICWLTAAERASADYLTLMEELRLALNASLFLGLFSYEAHYACYPPGAFYRTHLDAFKGSRNRVLSTVYYLNRDWPAQAGGELRLYVKDANAQLEIIEPQFNRLLVFLSEEFPHEVLPATRPRYSIAGWFKGSP
jgi:SM-20-related protein